MITKVVLDAEGHWRIKNMSDHGRYFPALFMYKRRAVNVKRGLDDNKAWALRAANFRKWMDTDDGL